MSSSTFIGNPDVMIAGPPPPPPPPPPVSGQLPAMRINTVENAAAKRSQPIGNDAYEPPAAIQNAMLTKDKKPFTYTPGMGGKLDLSQIRSPRMARRVAKNANDEGIEGSPKLATEPKPSQPPAASTVANFLVQPQVAVPVFPTNVPIQSHINKLSQPSPINKPSSNATDRQVEPSKNIIKVDTKAVPITTTLNQPNTPESPNTPTQVTLAKAPTPWLQNKSKPQEELPEWVKRSSVNKAASGPSSESAAFPTTVYTQVQQSPSQYSPTKQKQEQEQYLTSPRPSQQSKPQQSSQQLQQQRQKIDSVTSQQINPIAQSHQHEHVIPIRIEDRPSVFDAKCQSGHHQFKQSPTTHHQQRWGQMPSQHVLENQMQNRSQDQEQFQPHVAALSRPEQLAGTTYIIPLVVEGSDEKTIPSNSGNNTTGKITRVAQQWNPGANQQHEPGPIQSKSFRVLQKITDTDTPNNVGAEQIRRMELSEDERLLMNKFKEQVDHEAYLHQEEDPRYRGAAIPSRAFRFLQNMTDSGDTSLTCAAPRNVQNANKKQNRNSKVFEETQANLPPSEQQVQEPKKYMGSAIPSRSFRILQAMTAPESITTQENHQADYTCQTENYLPGNQQGIFILSRPVSFWYPEGWSGCYPIHYNIPPNELETKMNKHSFPFYLQPNGSAHNEYASFYPVYDNNFAENAQIKVMPLENFTSQCGYAAMVYPQTNYNGVEQSHVDANSCNYVGCRFTTTDSSLAPNDKNLVENDSDNETRNTVLPDEINHLDAQLNETYNLRNADKNCNNNKNCIITAMNIVDKKNGTLDSSDNTTISNNIKMPEKTFGLRINIPNYTYIDTSDSSTCSNSNDSSDFSDSTSDNEDLSDSCQKKKCNRNNGTISNNTSSDSDSDSYVAYSTNLNPYEKLKRELPRIASTDKSSSNATTLECSTYNSEHLRNVSESSVQSEKVYSKENYFHYSDNRNPCLTFEQDITGVATKRYSDDEDRTDDQSDFNSCPNENQDTANSNCELNIKYRDQECPVIDDTVSYQLGIIHNDTERPDSESISCENKRNIDERNETFSKASDDSSDDAETTMVSVSLPLKFKFFVSEDNEDITTVIIGNSKINAEKSCSAKDSVKDNKAENVSVNFHIGNDTSVDFTMKRDISDATCATTSTNEKAVNIESVIPQVDFTLKKDRMRISETSCEKQNSMELTVTKTEHDEINCTEPASRDVDHTASQSVTVTQDVLLNSEIRDNVQAEFICNNFENIYSDKTIADNEPKVATFEYCETQNDFISEPQVQIQLVDTDKMEQENYTIVNNNDDTELCCQAKLSVQDSRENTDDEDSGVTSDISRIISEVDTDSECTSSKHLKKYQRTQTHSRLFRLLNDDSVPSKTDSSFRKKYLSLPLNTDAFNCDDSCCSNHSSGLTSPEYSPIHEQSLGKFYSTINGNIIGLSNIKMDPSANQSEQIPSKEDPYFRFWKNPNLPDAHKHDVVPSLAFKILDSKMPSWAYKANVLCPRIKSTKNVPQTLSTIRKMNKIKNPSPSPPANLPIPTSYANSY